MAKQPDLSGLPPFVNQFAVEAARRAGKLVPPPRLTPVTARRLLRAAPPSRGQDPFEEWTIDGLLRADIAEPVIPVDQQIIQGLTVLGGSPGDGKTTLINDWGFSIATGTPAFGEFLTVQSHVGIFSFEHSNWSLQHHWRALMASPLNSSSDDWQPVPGLWVWRFRPEWADESNAKMFESIFNWIERHLDEHPSIRVVFIDPLLATGAKLYPLAAGFETGRRLKALAEQRGIAIVVAHHSGKGMRDDILGSIGLRAALDTFIFLRRDHEKATSSLKIVKSRDLVPREWLLEFDGARHVCIGEPTKAETENNTKILAFLDEHPDQTFGPKAVADGTGINENTVKYCLNVLVEEGHALKPHRGEYQAKGA